LHSAFALILPFLEQGNIHDKFDFRLAYNASPANQAISKNVISAYVCPTGVLRSSPRDSLGYGCVDYGATFHSNIDPVTERPNKAALTLGALGLARHRLDDVVDGASNTIAIAEDAGRNEEMSSLYEDPIEGGVRKQWRWADPDNAFGVSWAVNFHLSPWDGPEDCPWLTMNCGPNDEVFSFHPGGAQAVFCDGHVQFLKSEMPAVMLRALVSREGGEPVSP
jgi:prepilin-type processing-associated H-X9-DG protein